MQDAALSDLLYWLPTPAHHLLVVVAALLIYVVNARARRERRAPASAIAWVMGLVLLPYLMLPLYLMFGSRKLPVAPRPETPLRQPSPHWAARLLAELRLEPPGPVQVRFHRDGIEARDALWALIDSARDTLDVATFLIGNDALGREALQRLVARANDGVRVRLLYDGLSSWIVPRSAVRALREAGADVRIFHPVFALRRTGPRNLRNHRKVVIADNARLWAGGRNLAGEYFTGNPGHAIWRDLSFDLEGAVAPQAQRQFEDDWASARGGAPPPRKPARPVAPLAGSLAQFLPSGPDQEEDNAQQMLIEACFRAERCIIAATPYFVPDGALLAALRLAARRGVQVKLVIPARSNHELADFVRGRALRELAQVGADIRLLPVMSHAKAVVVDDSLALCGSINLDCRSLLLNYECGVLFYGKAEVAWLTQWILSQQAQCTPFDARPPGLLRDLAEGALLAVAFQV